ncbi:MAG: alpha/beta fold hydrolase [Acidimicrobiia bacterium]|nr:alpha/beta fold hydrolase [Acidimicrobiia bacterium]
MAEFGTLILEQEGGGQGQEFLLSKPSVTIGRATTNDVPISDPKVSRFHARVDCAAGDRTVVDLGSANGTSVGGARVERARLRHGDAIRVGDTTLRFNEAQSAGPEAESPLERATLLAVPTLADDPDLERSLARQTIVALVADTSVARLAVHWGDRTWEVPITEPVLSIGRGPHNGVVIDDPQVSRHHARVEARAGGFWATDAGSTNGTWIGGRSIDEQELETGTEVRVGPATLVFKGAVSAEELTVRADDHVKPAARAGRLPVVFVPGFMGSEMWDDGRLVWPNAHLALAKPEIFSWPEKKLAPRSILREHVIVPNFISLSRYSRLVDYLVEELGYGVGEDLLEFPYDWRQDVRQSARQLADAVTAWRTDKGHGDIAVIAHSMGCLITRYYVERLGGKGHVRRVALVGGLNAGSPKSFQAFLAARGMLAFNSIRARFQQVVATFPSVYQSLPAPGYECVVDAKGDPIDVFADDGWLPEDRRPYLKEAADLFAELGTGISVPTVCVFGYGMKTPVRLVVERQGPAGWEAARLDVTDNGDDTIPQESAIVEGADIHPVQQHHGVLYTDADVRMRLRVELAGR